MNIMRKLLVGRGACGTPEEVAQSSQHTALGLMHLHKLFAELIHSQEPLNQHEQEQRLYNMLPLFCKVFGNSPASDLMDKFSDILNFCQLVSRLMVSEIRRRASNQSTEAASCAIAKFLEIESTEEQSNGWMLLTTINLLSAGGPPLIEVMTSSSLPSTLVKCLYLFFDLSEQENPDELGPDCEFTLKERRILLQKVFVQVLVRLCSNVAPAEELARKDDLTLLFSAITSWCPPHNTVWRKSAAEVLMSLSRHGLTNPVVSYIHTKGCVGLCIENMQRVQELSPLEIVDMFVTVFCFLKDSSDISQILLDDFRSCQGYIFLSDFLLRLEQNSSSEACEALRNIILLIASLTNCGYFDLKPSHASTGVLFQIPGFQMPMPSGRGVSVRNIQAFQVLQSVFLKAQTTYLCNLVLDAISTVYHSDKANYFILESQHTLSQLAEKVYLKPSETQEKFFKLFEFIIFEINYVPCKELISLSLLLKTQSSMSCSISCLRTLISVLQYQNVFKDVFREVGLLEVLVTCLHRYASQLKEVYPEGAGKGKVLNVPEEQQTLGELTMEALTLLLNNNSNNAAVFRESGGARCAHNLVPYSVCRLAALGIVQQLVLNNGGDDDMGTLLGLMHTAPVTALDLKSHILKSLLFVLRESHRTRTVFRKVGGFVYVMSVLVSMEGCLASPPKPPWDAVEKKEIMSLLRTVFSTLAMAMRYEPANARFFASEICHTSLTDTIRLLGCFTDNTELKAIDAFTPTEELTFHAIFTNGKDTRTEETTVPDSLVSVSLVIRLLYDMALDAFDRPSQVLNWVIQPPALKRWHSESTSVNEGTLSPTQKRSTIVPLSLTPPAPEPVIVHPGVVMTVLHLLPSVQSLQHPKAGLTLQVYLAEVLRSLVRSERNQQVMCEAGLPGDLLGHCTLALEGEGHPLHPSLQYILERLSAQALEPKDLRAFLRLGSPLCCTPFDAPVQEMSGLRPANQRDGGPVPLTRVKTLVSMTTPRDCRLHGTAITPPFVEFDMSSEGFSCLFVPSIAPQSAAGPAVVGVGMVGIGPDSSVIGGIGTGDRVFPPQPGLTFSTWFCVDKFSDNHVDPHPVRLFTLVRQVPGREDHLICFNLQLSPRDKSILITTQETPFNQSAYDFEPEAKDEVCARIWTPELLQESQWHHLVVVLNRAVLKNSAFSLYVDGQLIKSQKMHYISQNPGGGAANLTVASSVHGFIGTPPQFRHISRLVWKQGPCHLLEDVLSPHAVSLLYNLGPSYVGSLQAPFLKVPGQDLQSAVVPEERVILGLNSSAVSVMTLARIRRVYTKTDCKSIAKMLGLSSHENATPIHILHNSAGHLGGPARSLGGVLIGYLGARVFVPRPVALTLQTVGGTGALLGLVAMAKDVEGLYAAVKALVCVARSNREAQQEMDYLRRYQTLAMLLRKKQDLLNSHILHLTFSLVGTVDSGRETTVIPNRAAFQDLLCNLEVWQDAPGDLHKSLYEHFYELVTESCEQKTNLQILRKVDMVSRLLQVLSNPRLSPATVRILCNLLSALLQNNDRQSDILCFGQFCAATLPSSVLSEKDIPLVNLQASNYDLPKNSELCDDISPHAIQLRNKCLQLLHSLMFSINGNVNLPFCEEVIRVLGMDWVLLFVQSHLHSSTVLLGLQLLTVLLSSPSLLQRFRDASQNGGWLKETEAVLRNRISVLLGFNVGASNNKSSHTREIKAEAYQVSGFQQLQWTLGYHTHITEAYFLLFAILLGQPAHRIPTSNKLSLDTLWSYLAGAAPVSACRGELCAEIAVVLLSMVRAMLNPTLGKGSLPAEAPDCPVILIQFLMFLYHNRPNFMLLCMTSEVLSALASTLFPLTEDSTSERNSTSSSPTEDFHSFSSFEDPVVIPHVETGGTLTSHPAHKIITDFIRVIIIDSLSLPPGNKQMPVIDMLLEGFPVQSSHSQQCEFITEVLFSLMEHLMAAQVLMGEQGGLPIATGGSYSNVAPNVFYLTATLVDKLWQGCYVRNSHEVLDFLLKLMNQIKKKYNNSGLDTLFRSLNRTILYQLSRPMSDVVVMTSVLLCLQKVLTFKELVFGPSNNESEFVGCLCYCLFQLTEEAHISMETSRHSTWHVNIPDKNKVIAIHDKAALVKDTACQVWDELFNSKRQVIEELYKISATGMASAVSKSQMANIHMARMLFHESSSKVWTTFLESEKRSSYSKETWQLHTQLQTKLQKVTGGLTRLATRKIKKEPTLKCAVSNMTYNEVEMWTLIHISVVRDAVELRAKHYQQTQQHLFKYLFEEWLQTETELTRERGLWGPPVASCLDKWMLDMTEGPFRMRKKMVKNELFYIHYPYRPEVEGGENRALKYKVATSLDSKEYYKRWRPETMVEQDAVSPESTGIVSEELAQDVECSEEREIGFQGLRTASLLPRPPVNRGNSEWEEEQESFDQGPDSSCGDQDCRQQEDNPDSQSVLRLLEEGEKISHMFRIARIQGLDTCEGLLLFGKEHFYVVDGFTLLKTREIRDIDSLPANMHDPIIPSSTPRNKHQKRTCSKFAYEDIREVHKRRYLLQPIALEVFSADGRNYLLAFPRTIRNKVYARFLNVATAITDNAQESLSGQKRGANVESSANLLSSLIGETSVTQRWVRGEISNFQYLMHLNTLAGRSYNDLMQYPVFPWVLADYESEELDFNNPKSFRDLSKPMGAQTPDRLSQFKKRFREWDDPHGETPPYHFGTFYSSAMIVASYLVRMEPFTQHFLRLQGGHFDLADRMFHSVRDAWLSASKHNMADVKELIPEFFYLPEFLENSNRFDLGHKQCGIQLDDVILPSWAKNDPREFIRVHRQALECDYVSCHLHEWIDLIFGCKQQGQPAVEAVNVFHHLFYEGNVDIYTIDDPLKKNATIGFINNFGQIPKQLFKKPHPVKKLTNRSSVVDPGPIMPGLSCSLDKLFFHNLDNLKPSLHPVKEVKGPVGQVIQVEKSLLSVEQNKILVPSQFTRYVAWGFADHSIRIGLYENERAQFVCEDTPAGEILCCACPNEKTIVTAGTNTMVTVWQWDKKRLHIKRNLYGHTEAVTCLTASRAYNLVVSGSRDHTCILWDLSRLTLVRQLHGHPAPVAAVAINELTGDIASCAGTFLYVWSINGQPIASMNTAMGRSDKTQQILCVAFSTLNEWDNQNVIMTGATDGVVRMWSTDYVQVPIDEPNRECTEDDAPPPDNSTVTTIAKPKSQEEPAELKANKGEEIVRRMSLADTENRKELFEVTLLPGVCHKVGSESSLSEEDESFTILDIPQEGALSPSSSQQLKACMGNNPNNKNSSHSGNSLSVKGSSLQHSKSIGGMLGRGESSHKREVHAPVLRSSTVTSTKPTAEQSGVVGEQGEETGKGMRVSKSDTSLADNNPPPPEEGLENNFFRKHKKKHRILREGFKWQCQLVFRSKLTMHTAFDRKDNTDPAAVTALAVSKDHKTVYVGDSKGRVFSWSVTDHPGRADHWIRDEGGDVCLSCSVRFSFAERRHHCRNCGQLFCSKCSRFESEITRLRILKPVRVCQTCYQNLRTDSWSSI